MSKPDKEALTLQLLNLLMADQISRQIYAKEIRVLFRLLEPVNFNMDVKLNLPKLSGK